MLRKKEIHSSSKQLQLQIDKLLFNQRRPVQLKNIYLHAISPLMVLFNHIHDKEKEIKIIQELDPPQPSNELI